MTLDRMFIHLFFEEREWSEMTVGERVVVIKKTVDDLAVKLFIGKRVVRDDVISVQPLTQVPFE